MSLAKKAESAEQKVPPDDTTISLEQCPPGTFVGKVVGVSGNKLVMENTEGESHEKF